MSDVVAMSPSFKKDIIEDIHAFDEIIADLLSGRKVARLEWDNKGYWLEIVEEKLKIHKPEGTYHNLIVTLGDMTGEDWYVLD